MANKKPRVPKVGDKVRSKNGKAVYTVWHVSADGKEVNIHIEGTLIERYRVNVDNLVFLDEE